LELTVNSHKRTIHLESLPNWAASTKHYLHAFADIQKRVLSCEIADWPRLLSASHNYPHYVMNRLSLVLFRSICHPFPLALHVKSRPHYQCYITRAHTLLVFHTTNEVGHRVERIVQMDLTDY